MEGIWSAYVRSVTGGAGQKDIADTAGVNQGTISRWLNEEKAPTSGAVVASFCRAYGRNVLEGFVAAGMLEESEAGRALTARERAFLADLRGGGSAQDIAARARKIAQERAARGSGGDTPKARKRTKGA